MLIGVCFLQENRFFIDVHFSSSHSVFSTPKKRHAARSSLSHFSCINDEKMQIIKNEFDKPSKLKLNFSSRINCTREKINCGFLKYTLFASTKRKIKFATCSSVNDLLNSFSPFIMGFNAFWKRITVMST